MRIAIISTQRGTPWAWGGSEVLWAAAAGRALDERHAVGLFLHRPVAKTREVAALVARGADLFPREPRHHRVSFALRSAPLLDRRWSPLEAFDPDALLINQGATFDLALDPEYLGLLDLLDRSRVPLLVVSHGGTEAMLPAAEVAATTRRLFARAHAAAFVSRRNVEIAERQLAASLPNAVVVRNPVAMDDLAALPWPETEAPAFACVSRLDAAVKGFDLLLEILAAPAWRDRAWSLSFCGDGADRGYLERLAAHLGVGARIAWQGRVDDVRAIWREHHALLLPSRSEALPLSLVEAMLCGRVVVATDVGGVREWLGEPATGFLAEGPTRASYGAALERAWRAREAWRAAGERAHAAAAALVDPDAGASLLRRLLDAVTAQGQPA